MARKVGWKQPGHRVSGQLRCWVQQLPLLQGTLQPSHQRQEIHKGRWAAVLYLISGFRWLRGKNLPAMVGENGDAGQLPWPEEPLKEEMAAHSRVLAC